MLLLLAGCSSAPPKLSDKAKEGRPSAWPTVCTETEPHPAGASIADKLDVSYEQVMDWLCGGETFDDILLALQTSRLSDLTAKELLERKDQIGWEAVWEERGLAQPPTGIDEQ